MDFVTIVQEIERSMMFVVLPYTISASTIGDMRMLVLNLISN